MRVSATPLISNSLIVGGAGLGVLAANVPSTGENGAGYLYNDLDLPTDNGKEVRGEIVVWPSAGTLAANEDSSFEFTGAPDGAYSFQYQLYVDGVLTGSPATVDLVVGGATTVSATLATVGVSAYQATVVTTTNVTVNATTATASVSTYPALITVGGNVTVNATLAAVGVSAYQATVVTNTPTIVGATLATASVTALDATVVTGVVVNATLASVSVSTFAASVSYDVIVSASVAGVSVQTYRATVNDGSVQHVTAHNNMQVLPELRIMQVL